MNSIRTTLTKLTARVRSARGQSFVEFALLLPVMLVLVLGTVDLGRAYFSSVALENAVKEGAFFGAREPECATTTAACADPHNVESRVEIELNGLTLQNFVAKCFAPGTTVFTGAGKALATCTDGDLYYVASKTPFTLVTPLISSLVGGTLTLSSSSTAVVVTSFETGSGTLPIPTTMPTATPDAATCTVPNFLTGPTKISGAQNVWVNIAGFTGLEPHHERRQRAEHRVAEQARRDAGTMHDDVDHGLLHGAGDSDAEPHSQPVAGADRQRRRLPPARRLRRRLPAPRRRPRLRPSARCPVLTGYHVTVAQGRWSIAGFSAANFIAVRPPSNDYTVGSQSITAGLLRPCLTTTITVDK